MNIVNNIMRYYPEVKRGKAWVAKDGGYYKIDGYDLYKYDIFGGRCYWYKTPGDINDVEPIETGKIKYLVNKREYIEPECYDDAIGANYFGDRQTVAIYDNIHDAIQYIESFKHPKVSFKIETLTGNSPVVKNSHENMGHQSYTSVHSMPPQGIDKAIEKIQREDKGYDFVIEGNTITYSVDHWTLSNGYSGSSREVYRL